MITIEKITICLHFRLCEYLKNAVIEEISVNCMQLHGNCTTNDMSLSTYIVQIYQHVWDIILSDASVVKNNTPQTLNYVMTTVSLDISPEYNNSILCSMFTCKSGYNLLL